MATNFSGPIRQEKAMTATLRSNRPTPVIDPTTQSPEAIALQLKIEEARSRLALLVDESNAMYGLLSDAISAENTDEQLRLMARKVQLPVVIAAAQRGVWRAELELVSQETLAAFDVRAKARERVKELNDKLAEITAKRNAAVGLNSRTESRYRSLYEKGNQLRKNLEQAQDPRVAFAAAA